MAVGRHENSGVYPTPEGIHHCVTGAASPLDDTQKEILLASTAIDSSGLDDPPDVPIEPTQPVTHQQ